MAAATVGRFRSRAEIDQVAIDEACAGRPVRRLGQRETHLAVLQLRAAGVSIRDTAERLGISSATVRRHRRLDAL